MKSTRIALFAAAMMAAPLAAQAAENVSFNGKMYASFLNVDTKGFTTTGTSIDRFYFGVKAPLNEEWNAQLTTDMATEATLGKKANLFVKYAFLENSSLIPDAKIRLGAAPMPWIGYVENVWGYRYVQSVLVDNAGFGASSDYGLHMVRTDKELGLDYAVSAVNGGGYATPGATRTVDLVARVSLDIPQIEGLTVSVGGRTGHVGNNTAANTAIKLKRANRYDLLAAYTTETFSVGFEYLYATNHKNVLGTILDPNTGLTYTVKTSGYSLFGQTTGGDTHFFARYDSVKAANLTDQTDTLAMAGVAIEPTAGLSLALVYKQADSIGAAVVGNQKVTSIGLMSQVKF